MPHILHTTVAPGYEGSVRSSPGLRTLDIAGGASAVVGTAGAAAVAGMPVESTRYRTVAHARKTPHNRGGSTRDSCSRAQGLVSRQVKTSRHVLLRWQP